MESTTIQRTAADTGLVPVQGAPQSGGGGLSSDEEAKRQVTAKADACADELLALAGSLEITQARARKMLRTAYFQGRCDRAYESLTETFKGTEAARA